MIGKVLGKDEVYAAMVLALSGYAMVVVARGGGPLSFEHIVARVLPAPVARGVASTHRPSTVTARRHQIAA